MRETRHQRSTAEVLLEVAQQFGSTLRLDRLLPMVLDRVTAALEAEHALFVLLAPDGCIEKVVTHNLAWQGPGHPLPVSQGLIEKVVATNDLVFVADAQKDQDFRGRRSVKDLAVRFMVGVPVHVEGRIGGVICVDSESAATEGATREVELLKALARLVGTAVENAQLFEEQQFRMYLLSQLAHDFRVPLSIISMNADLLSRHVADEDDEAHELIVDIAASAYRMGRMVENTLELARVERGTGDTEPKAVDLATALPHHINRLRVVAQPLRLRLEPVIPPDLPQAWTVLDWFWIILDNLLFNAIKFAESPSTIRVQISLREDRGPADALSRPFDRSISLFRRERSIKPPVGCLFLQLSVHNQGSSIPEEHLSTLFSPFSLCGRSNMSIRSTGIGLAIVDQCARHLGGVAWAETSQGEGVTFSFTIPTVSIV